MKQNKLTSRLVATVALVTLALPRTAAAQSAESFQTARDVEWLRPGAYVYVTDERGHRTGGRLRAVSPDTLTLGTDTKSREFSRADVAKVEYRDSLENGVWLGLGAGIAALATACKVDRDPEHCVYKVYYFGLPTIAASVTVGTLLDLSVRQAVTFGPNGRAVATFSLRPTITPQQLGMMASVSVQYR